MATLYYRPYTTELQNDDDDDNEENHDRYSGKTDKSMDLPEFQYIFHGGDDNDQQYKDPEDEMRPDNSQYKLAMRRMSAEIMNLRHKLSNISNDRHCETCGHHTRKMLVGDVLDLTEITKEELMKKYLSLKSQYDEISSKHMEYQNKVYKLQRELIQKNDREAESIKMSKAHSQQNAMLHKLQNKCKNMESTIREQEIIISKMEKQLDKNKKQKPNRKLSPITEVNTSREKEVDHTQKENELLRKELESLKKSIPTSQPIMTNNPLSDPERLELYQLLDKAENRILSLEKQLTKSHREIKKPLNTTKDDFGLSDLHF